jgi:DNA primase
MATPPFIDFKAVKEQSDFAAVLAFYELLPKRGLPRGRSFKITCPFHDDAEPSLSIDPAKKRFNCFGCGTKGNILEFVAEMEGLDRTSELRAAAEKLAAICGVSLARSREGAAGSPTKIAKGPRQARENRPALPELPPAELARNPGCYALKFIEHEHPYLAKRGIPPDVAEEFGIGFYGGKGSMRERIVIPVYDWWPDDPEESRLVAYIGRWPGDDVPKGEPRYRTPKEFQKHQVLYNLHRVVGAKHAYVVEGCFDTVALHAFGFPAVALMGNSISPEQVELLWRAGVRFATVLLDGNPEGRAAAPAVHQALGERGLFSRIGMLPEDTDPATVGRDTFMALHKTER